MKKRISVGITQPLLMYASDIVYKQFPCWDGWRPLKMSLLLPRSRKIPRPVLIWVCGGGFESMDRDVWMPEMQYFARNGYAVASIEYRTHNLSPFPGLIEDAKAAVRYLRAHASQFGLDPSRIAMMGESAGGYITSMVAVTGKIRDFDTGENLDQSSEIQAAVNIYGRTRQVLGWHEKVEQKRTRNSTELLLNGKPDDIPEIYEKATPSTYLHKDVPPFLIMHGSEDTTVPMVQNDLFYEDLVKCGIRADYYIIEGATHGSPHFYQPEIKALVLDFLNKSLG